MFKFNDRVKVTFENQVNVGNISMLDKNFTVEGEVGIRRGTGLAGVVEVDCGLGNKIIIHEKFCELVTDYKPRWRK